MTRPPLPRSPSRRSEDPTPESDAGACRGGVFADGASGDRRRAPRTPSRPPAARPKPAGVEITGALDFPDHARPASGRRSGPIPIAALAQSVAVAAAVVDVKFRGHARLAQRHEISRRAAGEFVALGHGDERWRGRRPRHVRGALQRIERVGVDRLGEVRGVDEDSEVRLAAQVVGGVHARVKAFLEVV